MTPFITGFGNELIKLAKDKKFKVDVDPDQAYRAARRGGREDDLEMQSALSSIRGKGQRVSRDYLASMLLGAASFPAAMMGGKGITRMMHNRQVIKELAKTKSRKGQARLQRKLQGGPIVGSSAKNYPGGDPLMSTSELAGAAGRGALAGSVLEMLRDRFAGAAGVQKND